MPYLLAGAIVIAIGIALVVIFSNRARPAAIPTVLATLQPSVTATPTATVRTSPQAPEGATTRNGDGTGTSSPFPLRGGAYEFAWAATENGSGGNGCSLHLELASDALAYRGPIADADVSLKQFGT